MAQLTRHTWDPDPQGLTRNDRRPCEYWTYIPDQLQCREVLLDGQTAAEVSDAEAAIVRLNTQSSALVDMEVLARILLRAESVASSRIEGLVIGARRLLEAEVVRQTTGATTDITAAEVLANVDAMSRAISLADGDADISVDMICDIHRDLMRGTHLEQHGGCLRTVQNWIGRSNYNPCSAEYVPPPPDLVEDLLEDICAFCNDDSLPALVQAAVAHAQFETVHPFVDGNGRTGRALIHMVLRRRGLAPRVLPPVSLVLATHSRDYIAALEAYRHVGPSDSREAMAGLNRWIALFSAACRRSAEDSNQFERRTRALEADWRTRLGTVRRGSAAELLIHAFTGAPVMTVGGAATMLDRSFAAVNRAMERLVEAGIVREVSLKRRDRAFEAKEAIDAFTALERQLASPDSDTRIWPPSRPVPTRPA